MKIRGRWWKTVGKSRIYPFLVGIEPPPLASLRFREYIIPGGGGGGGGGVKSSCVGKACLTTCKNNVYSYLL